MQQWKRWAAMAIAGLVVAGVTGCASFEFTKPAPAHARPLAVKVSEEELSGWSDLPIGTYRVPDSHVIISGHQKGQAAGMMFGLIGVAIAHAANQSAGESAVKDAEAALRMKLTQPLRDEIAQAVAQAPANAAFTTAGGDGSALVVVPGLVLTYVGENDVRPYVVLRTSLVGADQKPVWNTRYIASTGAARPLAGPGSWTEQGGEALKANVQASLSTAVKVMLTDVASPYKRDDAALSVAEGPFPFIKQRVQIMGYKLSEDERYVAFVPKLGDVLVFAGVNVLDKQNAAVRDAAKDDIAFKIVEPAKRDAPKPAP